jgi:hypothetical protein
MSLAASLRFSVLGIDLIRGSSREDQRRESVSVPQGTRAHGIVLNKA